MPNVLLLMSDQHTPMASGAYGSDIAKTPNLDRLAASGTTFDAAYCNSPICVPSRAALATGRYPHQTGNVDNASPYLGTEAPSWGHRIEESGFVTITVGKLHYRHVEDNTGFADQRLPLHVRGGTGDLFHTLRDRQPPVPQLRQAVLDTRAGESDYTRQDREVAAEAVSWLTDEAPGLGPWACHVSFVTPHYPFTAPQEYLDLYDPSTLPLPLRGTPETWDTHPATEHYRWSCGLDSPLTEAETRTALQHYYALVSFMDDQVGKVLDALEASGQADDTLILYVSDHGELLGTDGMWFKGTMNEGSARIPLLASGPGIPIGRRNTPVSLVDVYPTILDALGIDEPTQPRTPPLPGQSLIRLANEPDHDRTVFSEYHSANSASGAFMVRTGRFKYVLHLDTPERLFDLVTDPDENHDLADDPAYSVELEECRRALAAICDPVEVNRRIRAQQQGRIDEFGGVDKILARPLMTHSPVGSR